MEDSPAVARMLLDQGPVAAPDVYAEGMQLLADLVDLPDPAHRAYVVGGVALILRRRDLAEVKVPDLMTFAFGGS